VIESLGREIRGSDEATRLGSHPGTVQLIAKPDLPKVGFVLLGRVKPVELKVAQERGC